ncbi:thioesterase/thiol ester dehydrase-isomerase [Phanerochaete sordida]|uniref:Thioesterase/thiol ester dehydrase-isomerase n=1 Tax=Phanerochaete sordida TaxID=48140 RepID=A0A9P3GX18_9APHY|nr:thioesterase/thiol ester dehydrase-isomerase [Phanerochaete sordida]
MRHSGEIRHAMRQLASHPPREPSMWQATALRAFTTSLMNQNTAAEIARSKEAGAASETHDVTAMDRLLRAVRQRVRPERHTSFTMRAGVSWSESLRRSREGTPEPSPGAGGPAAHEAVPRTMADSYSEERLRFAREPGLLEAYTNTGGGVRTGMLMEHLDSLAGAIAYKHMLGPVLRLADEAALPFYLVTASVDRLDVLADIAPVRDIRLSGQVIHVGRTSIEVAVRMEGINEDGSEETVMLGRFCMVCRDSKTHKSFQVNPLVLETPEDQELFRIGEAHKNRRTTAASQSLAKVPPSSVEAEALHALHLQAQDGASELYAASDERVPMAATRLEKTMTMYPQERNIHQKIFGGYLMRLAYELGYSNATLFARSPLRFLSLDSISFARPVPIGSVLRLKSYIVHTTATKEFPVLIHVTVKASAVDIETGKEETTNDFRFTWCREDGAALPRTVVPVSYQEAMMWIEGKRALDLGTEIRGLRTVKHLLQPEDQ